MIEIEKLELRCHRTRLFWKDWGTLRNILWKTEGQTQKQQRVVPSKKAVGERKGEK